jgi:hypothetical protein
MVNWKKELKLCALDKSRAYMISKYIFYNDLWVSQKMLLKSIHDKKLTLSVKSRNVGYTSLMAAFVACEMVLRCDEENKDYSKNRLVVYITPNINMQRQFLEMVCRYIKMIPIELRTDICILKIKDNYLEMGNIRLMVTYGGVRGFSNSNNTDVEYVIYDEMITTNDDFDFDSCYEKEWYDKSDRVIIGGCCKHNNEKFYEFAKKYKEMGNYIIKMNFFDNPNNDIKVYNRLKQFSNGSFSFADEYDCEIYKLVKEKL